MGTKILSRPMGAERFDRIKKCVTSIVFILIALSSNAWALGNESLTCTRVLAFADKAFNQHVIYTQNDAKLRAQMLKEFVAALDPEAILILQPEIDRFTNISDQEAQSLYKKLASEDMQYFNDLTNKAIQTHKILLSDLNSLPNKRHLIQKAAENNEFARLQKSWAENRAPQTKAEQQEKILFLTATLYRDHQELGRSPAEAFILAVRQIERMFDGYKKSLADHQPERILNALLAAMDQHSHYFNVSTFKEFISSIQGTPKDASVGISIYERARGYELQPLPGGPAEQAGVLPGDMLIGVDGHDVRGQPIQKVSETIIGEHGKTANLQIVRNQQAIEIKIIRQKIENPEAPFKVGVHETVDHQKLGVIQLSTFYNGSNLHFKNAVQLLMDENISGLLFDLRGNPGGFREEALKILNAMVPSGAALVRLERAEGKESHNAFVDELEPNNQAWKGPVVILVDERSASASEVVARGLQVHQRAIIVGPPRTFGKATEQRVNSEDDDEGIKVTTAVLYSPDGVSINAKGVHPDIVIRPLNTKVKVNTDPTFNQFTENKIPLAPPTTIEEQLKHGFLVANLLTRSSERLKTPPPPGTSEDPEMAEAQAILRDLIEQSR